MDIKKWIPLSDIPERLYLEGLHDDYEGFRLLLKGEGNSKMLRISFQFNLGFRNFDESDRLKTLNLIPELCSKWSLFKVKDSTFTKWVIEESLEKYTNEELIHYIIATPNDIVEVLSMSEPKVEWLN